MNPFNVNHYRTSMFVEGRYAPGINVYSDYSAHHGPAQQSPRLICRDKWQTERRCDFIFLLTKDKIMDMATSVMSADASMRTLAES